MADRRIGAVEVQVQQATSSTLTNVGQSAASVQLLAAAERVGVSIYNDAAAALYLKEGSAASTSSFTVAIPPGCLYEFPSPIYAGVVHGIWASAGAGSARVTERT